MGNEGSHSVSPRHSWGIALSDSKEAEAFAYSLEDTLQPVTDPSVPAFIVMSIISISILASLN
jgi:hypothetical protein